MVGSLLKALSILVLISSSEVMSASALCGGPVIGTVIACFMFGKDPPSGLCCQAMKRFDMNCVCNLIVRPIVGIIINPARFISIAQSCGVNIPAGSACGAITVPAPGEAPEPQPAMLAPAQAPAPAPEPEMR